MTAIDPAPYDHDIYHEVTKPSLHAALDAFKSTNAMHYINTCIRDCFLRHNVEKQFTACVIHRHFNLSLAERNIEEHDGRAIASTDLNDIQPCSWLFHDGKLYPYEFKRAETLPEPTAEFVSELGAILQDNGLCSVIGLQAYTDVIIGVEKTDHEARISTTKSYPEGAPELEKPTNAVVASFAFF